MRDLQFLAKSALKSRGWTDALIRALLGDADKEAKNPHYRTGPAMRLYAVARVIEAELSDANKPLFARAAERSHAARLRSLETATSKRAALLDWIDNLPIFVRQIDAATLRTAAIKNYNDLWTARGKYDKEASVDSPEDFLSRIEYNFIRHVLTDYDRTLDVLFGQIGKQIAYWRLRERIDEAIVSAYPDLYLANAPLRTLEGRV